MSPRARARPDDPDPPPGPQPAANVLALAEDAASGERLLEWSSALARALDRELAVVYLESTAALEAAAWPAAQVLSHAGAAWSPLSRSDVELGFRAHAARLRTSAERWALRNALPWSFRVMRGSRGDACQHLWSQTNLLFLAASAPPLPRSRAAGRPARRRVIAARSASDADTLRALAIGEQLAQALDASFEPLDTSDLSPGTEATQQRLLRAHPDVVVLPRDDSAAAWLRMLRRWPLLLVG